MNLTVRPFVVYTEAFDGQVWPTEGRLFTLSGQCYAFLVVNQTTAKTMPCQQT